MANYEEVRSQVEELMQDNYKEFSKALVSIEKGIENEQTLDQIYNNFMYDDKASTLFDLDNQDYYKALNRSNDKSDDLDPVSYGLYEYFRGGSSNYISDDIHEVADSMVDVYTSDLEASLPDLRREGYYQRVADEFGLTGDLDKDIMAAQYLRNVDIINENLDDITRNALVYNLEKNEIPITEGIEEIIDNYSYDIDNNNSFYQLLDEFNGDISFELQEIAKERVIEKGIDPEVLEEYMYNIEDISVDNIPKDMKAIDYINKEVDKTIDDINLDKEQEISR